jgi:DNA primase
MPIRWDEVKEGLDPCDYTLATVPGLIAKQTPEPWVEMFKVKQFLPDGPRG